ncbi:MAG: acetyl-CoA C-acetyltransferase, partial [Pseudomonadota bacterium]
MSEDIVIAAGTRTPVGSFNGAFATVAAHDLGAAVIKEALSRAKVDANEVDEVVFGHVLTAGQGQN